MEICIETKKNVYVEKKICIAVLVRFDVEGH